jgi:nucleotide-binding universal stress UspA family protein
MCVALGCRMLVFAYDGSLNGDWVAHYAVRFAANTSSRKLRLIHIADASPESSLEERIARIAAESKLLGVVLETEMAPRRGANIAERLLEIVPERATLIAGTRAIRRNRAFLAGTVSARLLEEGRFSVIVMRVVHPGVLGQPGSVLLPIAGRNHQAALALPFLHLLGKDLQRLHLLLVRDVSGPRFHFMSQPVTEKLLAEGRALVAPIEDELRADLIPHRFVLDSSVVVSDDVPKEILLCAYKHRSRLIGLGASRRTLPERMAFRNPIEQLLRDSPSDVAVYRSVV